MLWGARTLEPKLAVSVHTVLGEILAAVVVQLFDLFEVIGGWSSLLLATAGHPGLSPVTCMAARPQGHVTALNPMSLNPQKRGGARYRSQPNVPEPSKKGGAWTPAPCRTASPFN